MSTRYAGDWCFDHGTQFFSARTKAFQHFLEPALGAGTVKAWRARFVEIDGAEIRSARTWTDDYPHYVACPNMNSLGKHLSAGLDLTLNVSVTRIERRRRQWLLYDDDGVLIDKFDWVIVTPPAPQAASLLMRGSRLRQHAMQVPMLPCFALMLGFDDPPETAWDAALVKNSPISWISVNSSKPDRRGKPAWVVHASNAWAASHLEDTPETVIQALRAAVIEATGRDVTLARHVGLHRWRYANVEKQARVPQVDAANRLAACGDWFVRGRVEDAFTSALHMVEGLRQAI